MIFVFVAGLVAAGLGLVLLVVGSRQDEHGVRNVGVSAAGVGSVLLALVLIVLSFTYRQTVGEAKAVKSFSGTIQKVTTEAGMHARAPWDSILTYDLLNNTMSFTADGVQSYDGNTLSGPQVTVRTSDKVAVDTDVQLTYSLDGEKVYDIIERNGSQRALVTKIVEPQFRQAVRVAGSNYTQDDLQNGQDVLAQDIEDLIRDDLADAGVIVERVVIQDLRPPASVVEAQNQREAANIEVETAEAQAKAELAKAEGEANAKIERARGEAEANKLIADSLSDEVLEQRRIDAMREAAGLWIVPEGSTPLITTDGFRTTDGSTN